MRMKKQKQQQDKFQQLQESATGIHIQSNQCLPNQINSNQQITEKSRLVQSLKPFFNAYRYYFLVFGIILFILVAIILCEVMMLNSKIQKLSVISQNKTAAQKYNETQAQAPKSSQKKQIQVRNDKEVYLNHNKKTQSTQKQCQNIFNSTVSLCQKSIKQESCKCQKMVNQKTAIQPNIADQIRYNCQSKSYHLNSEIKGVQWEINSYYPLIFQPNQLVNKTPCYFPTNQQLEKLKPQKDLIVVTHAGRREYLEILYKHLLKQKQHFFEWHLWARTGDRADISYMQQLQRQNKWIKITKIDGKIYPKISLMRFYKADCEKNKLYLKMDDDTVWMDPNYIKTMFSHRSKLSKYFIVFSNIINTAIHAHLQQRFGAFQYPQSVQYNCISNGWYNAELGAALHLQFIESIQKGEVQKWMCFKEWIALNYERISINAFMYYSQTFRTMEYTEKRGDELILTSQFTEMYKRPIVIVGDAISVHGAFYSQRKYFNIVHPQIAQKYKKFADQL